MPLGWRHWWIAFVASLGQMVGTAVATIAGVIIPLLIITTNHSLSSLMQGLIGAADLVGIMIGSVVFGKLSDRYGYLLFFRLCPLFIATFGLLAVFVPNPWVLVVSLFVIGFGIGGEYSLDSDYTSVLMPQRWKLVMLGLVKTGAAFGNIVAAALCWILVISWKTAANWPHLMWIVVIIGAVMFVSRIYFFESPSWLLSHGKKEEALKALHDFLGNDVSFDPELEKQISSPASNVAVQKMGFMQFVKTYKDKVILTGIPWMCEGLGVYGIGVFIPVLVMALGIEHQPLHSTALQHVAESVKTTFWISCIILPGFLLGILLAYKKVKEVSLQTWCFVACAVTLVLLLFSYMLHWPVWISLVAFMGFELFLNVGPHLVTYLLPPKVFPVEIRGQGTGIAASLGKFGATLAVFLIPLLLKLGGGILVLGFSAAIMAVGAIVTVMYGKKL